MHKKAKFQNLASDWESFRRIRNEIIDMIREAKKNQYIIKLKNSLIDKSIPPGKWWRIAKSVSKFKSTNTTNTPITVNGDIFFHPVDKANSINNYFTSVSNIDSEPDLPLAPCELSGIVINEQEVCDQFQILNISKPPVLITLKLFSSH